MSLSNPVYPEGHNLLQDKTVLITAAAGSGIGFATALRCAEEGARVMISDTHEERLTQAAQNICDKTSQVVPFQVCDVTQEEQVQALVARASTEFGKVDILINNAGLGGSAWITDMTDEQWYKVIDVTLNGTFRMTRAMFRHMQQHQSGVIVNNASVLGWRAQQQQAHYAAAKAGVMAFTRCAAVEGATFGVRVNAVAPSLAMHAFLNRVTSDELLQEMTAREAYGRAAETWEVANVMVFLASDYSSYMTGEVLSVSSQHP